MKDFGILKFLYPFKTNSKEGVKLMAKELSIDELGKYIQNNIRRFINDKTITKFELPKIKHKFITDTYLEIFEKDAQKSLLLSAKANDTPEIALQIAKGTAEDIISAVDRYDFPDTVKKYINQLSDTLPYA